MKVAGVKLYRSTWVSGIGDGTITIRDLHTGEEVVKKADAVVLATGRVPQDALARALEGRVAQVFTIGDALAARMLAAAPFEGQKFARLIGEPGAPATTSAAWFAPDTLDMLPFPADVPRPGLVIRNTAPA